MVFLLELTYTEILNSFDMKFTNTSITECTLLPGVYGIIDNILMFKSLLSDDVKVNFTIDDFRPRSNLRNNETNRFSKSSFFSTILGFTQNKSGPLSDFDGFLQLIPGTYKFDKPNNFTGVAKLHSKFNCINGYIVNGVRETY